MMDVGRRVTSASSTFLTRLHKCRDYTPVSKSKLALKRRTHLSRLRIWCKVTCTRRNGRIFHRISRCPRRRTFLALACASVRCAEHSDVSLRIRRTGAAERLSYKLLVGIAEQIATDASKLPLLGLEKACEPQVAPIEAVASLDLRQQAAQASSQVLVSSESATRVRRGLTPAEHCTHVAPAPPADPDPGGQGTQLVLSAA